MNMLMFDKQRYPQYGRFLLTESVLKQAKMEGVTTILTSGWSFSGQLNFLAKNLGFPEPILLPNQAILGSMGAYHFWDPVSLQPGQFVKVLYVSESPVELTPYFKACTPLETISFSKEQAFTHKLLIGSIVESYCYN